jgi:hypothetical protein
METPVVRLQDGICQRVVYHEARMFCQKPMWGEVEIHRYWTFDGGSVNGQRHCVNADWLLGCSRCDKGVTLLDAEPVKAKLGNSGG